MRLSLFIAKRYLISKKSHNLINVISIISVVGLSVGTMALIVVLSVFNGFEEVIKSLYTSFNADMRITAVSGKTINYSNFPTEKILSISGVKNLTQVVEEDALFKYRDKQHIAKIKGVSEGFIESSELDSMIVNGNFVLQEGNANFAVVGAGIAWYLDIYPENISDLLSVYVPKRGNQSSFNFENAFNSSALHPTGVFSVQQEFDEKYVFVPLRFAKIMMNYGDEVTSVEIRLLPDYDTKPIQESIKKILGNEFEVKNRYQQNETLFKLLKSEKTAIFFILVFILLLSSFNMIGSISILIAEKKKDIGILSVMGADLKLIRSIFFTEGMLISLMGSLTGLVLGFLLLYLQQNYGLLQLGNADGDFIISSYPVHMKITDFIYVFFTVLTIGLFATIYPVSYLTKQVFRGQSNK
ncbi:MAG: ABC transporter permease [Lentimicrobiaceae bacterium]|nr:ABC transporter permease [Lentimicrobiaceae bacterium]MBT3454542.1 ABC transporter permease [Lentimicrobiaceae bacterium]MBT3818136.1 ABC transporter permease [Lentimicrobiaceae bacterium]MBT4061445.1 ABC transporter permease [Lentimicrobiaceae bacterium]MBT4191177.1 ABC transporter permease [Lentimicrobiaceae bacterium]